MAPTSARGLIALLRLPYWLMSGGLALLTASAIATEFPNLQTIILTFISMALITSAGFSVNDYFDRESDAVIKPKRPIPSGALSLKQVIVISVFLFGLGLSLALLINTLSFIILLIDSIVLVFYSAVIKRKSGFAANVLVGLLVGTAFLYGEAVTFQTISFRSLALYPICFGTIGGNILRDILSFEGDSKIGYPTLPRKIGNKGSIGVAALFFILTAVLSPLPYFFQFFGIYYLSLIVLWGILLVYSSFRLLTSDATARSVKKYERIITMSMMLLLLSLIIEALA